MSASVTIPIAGFKDVYDVPAVEKALHGLPAGASEALRALYEKMLKLGGQRFVYALQTEAWKLRTEKNGPAMIPHTLQQAGQLTHQAAETGLELGAGCGERVRLIVESDVGQTRK